MKCISKIVVFDLDETLGYFMELGMFWDALKGYIKHKQLNITFNQNLFNQILDLYPEFLRPNIMNILTYLKKKKERTHCEKLMVYTNNQGPEEWAQYILGFFDYKLNYKLFDQIIAAFKVQGKRVELCRTTHMKTHNDFIKCTQVPKTTYICFLDDVFYPDMSNDNIYYINIKPYTYDLSFENMIQRFIDSDIISSTLLDSPVFTEYVIAYMQRYNYHCINKTMDAYTLDKVISKKILHHLHLFFKMKPNHLSPVKTKRNKTTKNKTLKKRNGILV
jgi:hypothetical protein